MVPTRASPLLVYFLSTGSRWMTQQADFIMEMLNQILKTGAVTIWGKCGVTSSYSATNHCIAIEAYITH